MLSLKVTIIVKAAKIKPAKEIIEEMITDFQTAKKEVLNFNF